MITGTEYTLTDASINYLLLLISYPVLLVKFLAHSLLYIRVLKIKIKQQWDIKIALI